MFFAKASQRSLPRGFEIWNSWMDVTVARGSMWTTLFMNKLFMYAYVLLLLLNKFALGNLEAGVKLFCLATTASSWSYWTFLLPFSLSSSIATIFEKSWSINLVGKKGLPFSSIHAMDLWILESIWTCSMRKKSKAYIEPSIFRGTIVFPLANPQRKESSASSLKSCHQLFR